MDVGGVVKLSVGSDFIAPSLACTKPKQIEPAPPKGTSSKHVLRIEGSGDEAMQPTPAAPVARITLNDCLACSGCVTSAETMLISQQSADEFLRGAASAQLTLLSISPAARAAIATDAGLGLRETFCRLSGFFKQLGCHRVLDCGLASDLSLMQNAAEFVERFRRQKAESSESSRPLPLVSSSCPGWVCYAEKTQGGKVIEHLSRAKSPQQVAGTLLKHAYGAALGVPPERIYHASVMPCFDKKLEASREDFADAGARDVDCVLSSGEVLELLHSRGLSLKEAPLAELDTDPPLSALGSSGALCYAAPSASGGCAEFVFRFAARELFGVSLPPTALEWKAGRNADISEASLEVGGQTVLRFCRAYGFRNIQNAVRRLKAGLSPYHYIELMACPGGCANGGGQPRAPPLEAPRRREMVERLFTADAEQREPFENPQLQALLAPGGFLEGGFGGERAQRHLLTNFHDRNAEQNESSALTTQW